MRGGFKKIVNSNQKKLDNTNSSVLLNSNLGLLKKYLLPHRKKLVIAVSATMLVAISALIGPYLIKIAIDDYIIPKKLPGLIFISTLILLSYIVSWFSSYWQTYLAEWVGQDLVSSLRKDLFTHVKNLDLKFYTSRRTGEIMSRITHDVNALSELITGGFVHFVSDIFTLIGIFAVMFFMEPKLTLIVILLLPLLILIFWLLGKKMRYAYHDVQEQMARLNADVEENISGIRTIKALNRENITQEKFNQLSINNMKANLRAVGIFSLFFPAMNFSRVLGEALILGYGGIQVIEGNMTIGVLAAFLGYVRRFFRPIMDLSQVYNTYQAAGAALGRINEYFNIPIKDKFANDVISSNRSNFVLNDCRGEVSFEDVNFSYDQNPILRAFNLVVPAGKTIALVGASGVGKSTVIKLLTRLYEPDDGKIKIDGIDIKRIPPREIRKLISVVSQNVQMFNRTIEDNIRYGTFDASIDEIKNAAKKTHAHEFITKLPDGYKSQVGKDGIKLSGGQKQLISLTRVILKDPKILVLDEPTSNVDTYTESLVIKTIENLLKERTTILISHRMSTVRAADEIVYINPQQDK